MTVPIHRDRKLKSTMSKEEKIVSFLYDEGPHLTKDIATALGYNPTTMARALRDIYAEGLIDRAYLVKGSNEVYWLYKELT